MSLNEYLVKVKRKEMAKDNKPYFAKLALIKDLKSRMVTIHEELSVKPVQEEAPPRIEPKRLIRHRELHIQGIM